ncbi:MAG TPA: PKD domain-containing protein, partial [Bacteroidia bacterium]|nr:PKD domain-containing protein [Bacteroidia bacterium]
DTIGTATFSPTGGSPPYTYVWTPNVSSTNNAINLGAGVYSVNVTDNFGCQNSATFTITEPPNVPIVASVTGTSPICTGYSATLVASASGGAPPYSYSWITPASTNDTVVVSPATTTTYSVVVHDACFTIPDTATFTVVVNPSPAINFTGDILSGCVPLCVDFTGQSNPGIANATWNFGDNSTGTGPLASHCYYNNGNYDITLHVTDVNGCIDSLTQASYIHAYPNPIAGFNILSANPATLLEPTVVIDDISTGGDTCYWDFGDGHTLTVVGCGDVSNAYADTGAYHVTEIVVNQFGCADTIAYDVYVIPYTTLYVPNSFTPNGNGVNDVFMAVGEYVDDFHMMVFDRWGNMIFESNDQDKGWDGKANGGKFLAQEDTYVWVITYVEQYDQRRHKIIGHVNLIR